MPALTPHGTSKPDQERARLVAASALVVLALLALMLILGAPKSAPPSDPRRLDVTDIARFMETPSACPAVLRREQGVEFTAIPDLREGRGCGYRGAVELTRSLHPYSQTVAASCALAAALVLWERDVVGPAAARHYGQGVARIEMAGPSYTCRPIAGRTDRRLSEHAHANAADIAGFTLEDGRVVTVAQGWRGRPADRAFLTDVRDGACGVFQGVLSPDYNRAHRDHFHLDLGRDDMCR
jgi:hypothetical protein